jgi:hypothetical protein
MADILSSGDCQNLEDIPRGRRDVRRKEGNCEVPKARISEKRSIVTRKNRASVIWWRKRNLKEIVIAEGVGREVCRTVN